MMTIEKRRDVDRTDNYKCYLIKCSVTGAIMRVHTRHGKESWQRYTILIVGLESLMLDRGNFARMLKRIRTDNRKKYIGTA